MLLTFLDTETGGIPSGVSVLTVTLTTFRFESNRIVKISELDLKVKPDDDLYVIDPTALTVNGINLVEHHKTAIKYSEAGRLIYQYLTEMNKLVPSGKVVIAGQNVEFDIRHIVDSRLISRPTWNSLTDIRVIDTITISKFAQLLGKIPTTQSLSLGSIAKYLKIPVVEEKLHTASYDNEVTAKVLFELGRLISKPNKKESFLGV